MSALAAPAPYSCRSLSPEGIPCAGTLGHVETLHGSPLEDLEWRGGINTPAFWDGDVRPEPAPDQKRRSRAKSRGQRRAAAERRERAAAA